MIPEGINIIKNIATSDEISLFNLLVKNPTKEIYSDNFSQSGKIYSKDMSKITKDVLIRAYPIVKDIYNMDISLPHETSFFTLKFIGSTTDRHYDDEFEKSRAISAIIYWNDDFEGGELLFPLQDWKYKPRAGDMVIFPSTNKYYHHIQPTSGTFRYTTPYWYRYSSYRGQRVNS